MDDTTTPVEVAEVASGGTINGIPVDESGVAIPYAEPEVPQPEAPTPTAEVQTTETHAEAPAEPVSAETDELKAWAEKKGLDLSDPLKVAQVAREAERNFHAKAEEAKRASELREQIAALEPTVSEVPSYETPYGGTDQALVTKVQQLENQVKVSNFYSTHPDATQYDTDMAELVRAKPYLAQDLDTLLELAKARKSDTKAIEERVRQEVKAELARNSAATLPTANATTTTPASDVLTPANVDTKVASMSLEEYTRRLPEIEAVLSSK